MAGIIGVRRQGHERAKVSLHALSDCICVAAQHRLAALDTGITESCIERIKTFRNRQRRHEAASEVTHQTLNLAFIIAFARPAKAVFKQIVALQLSKHLRAQPLTTFHNLGYGKLGVIVKYRLGHAAKIGKCRHMAITEGFSRLSWIGFDKAAIRMRQSLPRCRTGSMQK